MLVLKIKPNSTVKVGDSVIRNLEKHKSIRVGIDAPKEVPVVRGELVERKAA